MHRRLIASADYLGQDKLFIELRPTSATSASVLSDGLLRSLYRDDIENLEEEVDGYPSLCLPVHAGSLRGLGGCTWIQFQLLLGCQSCLLL